MAKKIIFATNNSHKLEEVRAILGDTFEIVTLKECGITEDIPEEQPTIKGNALQKARYVYDRIGLDCFADDTGLEVEALNGEPGVRSARYASEGHDFVANMELLLNNMLASDNRKARFKTVIAFISDGKEYTFDGIINGEITHGCNGDRGFGYDPIFVPDGYTQTFAQMPASLKNSISHRALAVCKFTEFLKNGYLAKNNREE